MTKNIQHSLEKHFIKVSSVNAFSNFLSIGMQLVSVPVCLHYWGNDIYGTWLAILSTFTLTRTIDSGYIGYIGNKINILYHTDLNGLRVTLASALWGIAILGMLQLLILSLLYITDSIRFFMDLRHSVIGVDEAALALLILCFTWILTGSYIGILHRLLIPAGLMYQASLMAMGLQLIQFCGLIVSAIFGLNMFQTASLFALLQALAYFASAVYVRFRIACFYPWWKNSNRDAGLNDLIRSVPFIVGGILQQGATSGLFILVSGVLGPAALPAFTTARTLSNLWTTLINILTEPLLPEVVRFHSEKRGEQIVILQKTHWLVVGNLINLSILIAFPFLETTYRFWTQGLLTLDKPLVSFLLASIALTSMSALMKTLLYGVNHLGFLISSSFISGGLPLLGLILLPVYGTKGLGFAIFIAEVIASGIIMHWLFRRELIRIGTQTIPGFLRWSWFSSGCVIIYLLAQGFEFSFFSGIYWIALAGALVGIVFAWMGIEPDVRIRLISFINPARLLLQVRQVGNKWKNQN